MIHHKLLLCQWGYYRGQTLLIEPAGSAFRFFRFVSFRFFFVSFRWLSQLDSYHFFVIRPIFSLDFSLVF